MWWCQLDRILFDLSWNAPRSVPWETALLNRPVTPVPRETALLNRPVTLLNKPVTPVHMETALLNRPATPFPRETALLNRPVALLNKPVTPVHMKTTLLNRPVPPKVDSKYGRHTFRQSAFWWRSKGGRAGAARAPVFICQRQRVLRTACVVRGCLLTNDRLRLAQDN